MPSTRPILRVFALGAAALALSAALPPEPVSATDRTDTLTRTCTLKTSGFLDWGKAASSARDMHDGCNYIQTRLFYGTLFTTWMAVSGYSDVPYVKAVAGVYDWKVAQGRASNNGGTWNTVCNPEFCG